MSDTRSVAQKREVDRDRVTTDAMRRDQLADLIGRLLARVMLRRQAEDAVASKLN